MPVVGHVGLTPQSATSLGGYRAQGRTAESALRIARGAVGLQEAGCFSIVFEAVPSALTAEMMPLMTVPIIGIGAGPATDGQVLVFHDLLGIREGKGAKFVRRYADLLDAMADGVAQYAAEVRDGVFPAAEHGYGIDEAELAGSASCAGGRRGPAAVDRARRVRPGGRRRPGGRLVRLRTVNDAGGDVETPAADLVAGLMRGFGWHVTVTEVAPGRQSVVGVIDGTASGRTLMFEGHVDVVTEGDPATWSFDPYAGDVVDGRLRGRGSADMKSGVAAMIHAARAVQLGGFAGRLVVGVLADEEGMMLGAKRFAADLAAGASRASTRIDGVIVCEPEGGEVCPVAKGAMRITVEFTGAMAHGAMPRMGRNPLPAIGSLLIALPDDRARLPDAGRHPPAARATSR